MLPACIDCLLPDELDPFKDVRHLFSSLCLCLPLCVECLGHNRDYKGSGKLLDSILPLRMIPVTAANTVSATWLRSG